MVAGPDFVVVFRRLLFRRRRLCRRRRFVVVFRRRRLVAEVSHIGEEVNRYFPNLAGGTLTGFDAVPVFVVVILLASGRKRWIPTCIRPRPTFHTCFAQPIPRRLRFPLPRRHHYPSAGTSTTDTRVHPYQTAERRRRLRQKLQAPRRAGGRTPFAASRSPAS